jgi:LAO/AO transport system kinase
VSTTLADDILDGDVRSASRLMRWLDDGRPEARAELDALYPHTGNAYFIGFTGHPGSGKSTLVDAYISLCRERDLTVACLAVDPSSPFSGGAILGDRVRMNRHALDDGVFIRSVATRGNLGGLSRSTPASVQVMDAMGFDIVLIETVGVGQDEIDIVRLADTNVVVMVPGLGDDIQATKAGVMEIADIFAVNKSDLDGADRVVREIKTMLSMNDSSEEEDWVPSVLKTVATEQDGIEDLFEAVDDHRSWLEAHRSDRERDRRRIEQLVRLVISGEFDARIGRLLGTETWKDHLEAVLDRTETPYEAADALFDRIF